MQCYNDVFQFNVSSQRQADSIQGKQIDYYLDCHNR